MRRSMASDWQRPSAAVAASAILLASVTIWGARTLCGGSSTALLAQQIADAEAITGRRPPVYRMIEGQEVVYERPPGPARAILMLFHGCKHSAIDFWVKQQACETCIGLPEEKLIVRAAIKRQYVPVAFSSLDRDGSRCWDAAPPPTVTDDVRKTLRSLNIIRDAESWHDLPTFAMGASSGGAFVLLLPFHMQLQGICAQIMGVPSQLWAEQLPSLSWRYPPTAFVHMSRDTRTAAVVADDLKALGKAHVPTREISIEPSPMTAATLSDVIEEVDADTSQQIFQSFTGADMFGSDGRLRRDPRTTSREWQALLKQKVPAVLSLGPLEADQSPIFEELNVLWAGHEVVASVTDTILDWFESQTRNSTTTG